MFVQDRDGNMLVIDEWESREAFDRFFAAQEIKRTISEIGITGEHSAMHYQVLDTSDRRRHLGKCSASNRRIAWRVRWRALGSPGRRRRM